MSASTTDFDGNTVTLSVYSPAIVAADLLDTQTATVVPGTTTFPNTALPTVLANGPATTTPAAVDVSGTNITIDVQGRGFSTVAAGTFVGYVLDTPDTAPTITSASETSTGLPSASGLNPQDLTFSAHSVLLNLAGEQLGNKAVAIHIAVQFARPAPPGIAAVDTTTGQPDTSVAATAYTGPVSGIASQYINLSPDNLNVSASTPDWFLHTGSGNDAIAASSGTNVLDGGAGSNFLTGGSGTDTFFVDDRVATTDFWSTVNNFHTGDATTIWGVTPADFNLAWADGQGAAGFTGLTLHATAAGKPIASLTLAGFTTADLSDGRLGVSFGTDPASGSAYMYIHANS